MEKIDLSETFIHCPTEDWAKRVIEKLQDMGYRWCKPHSSYSLWWLSRETTYYRADGNIIKVGDISLLDKKRCKIISAKDFIGELKENPKKQQVYKKEEIVLTDTDIEKIFQDAERILDKLCGRTEKLLREIDAAHLPLTDLEKAAAPLMDYLKNNHHPHCMAMVSADSAELLEGIACTKR